MNTDHTEDLSRPLSQDPASFAPSAPPFLGYAFLLGVHEGIQIPAINSHFRNPNPKDYFSLSRQIFL